MVDCELPSLGKTDPSRSRHLTHNGSRNAYGQADFDQLGKRERYKWSTITVANIK